MQAFCASVLAGSRACAALKDWIDYCATHAKHSASGVGRSAEYDAVGAVISVSRGGWLLSNK